MTGPWWEVTVPASPEGGASRSRWIEALAQDYPGATLVLRGRPSRYLTELQRHAEARGLVVRVEPPVEQATR